MADRHKKGEIETASVAIGRRAALARFGLGVSVAYAAPVLLTLSSAQAGVVVGDGDLNNNGGADGGTGSSGSSGNDHAPGHYIGKNRRRKPEGGGERMTLQDLLNYLANFSKRKK